MSTPVDGRTTLRGRGNSSIRGGGGTAYGSGTAAAAATTGSASGSAASGTRSRGPGGGTAGVKEMSQRLQGIESRLSLMEMGARAGQISFTSLIDGDLSVYDLLGELKMKVGVQSDGRAGVSYVTGTPPPTPTDPMVSARQLYIVIGWDGEFVDDIPRPSDLARVDVHVSNEPDFEPSGATAVGSLFGESVCIVPGDIEDHWVRLVAVTLGDVPSVPTDAFLVRPLPADKIAAESIAAIHLASEIILGSTIIAGDPRGAHMEMNETGLRMVREDGTPTVVFSADEGNALITGSIQTALRSSGKSRIVFNPFPDRDWNEIRFYAPNDTAWSSLFTSRDRNGVDGAIALQGPYSQGDPLVTVLNLGESHLLAGVFSVVGTGADGTSPFTDGLLVSTPQTALVGGGGPFIVHNYKRPTPTANPAAGTRDPFVAFTNSATSAFNGHSVLEFTEFEDQPGYRWGAMRNLGTDLSFKFGDGPYARFAFRNYQNTYDPGNAAYGYVPIAAAGFATLSSEKAKTDISDITEHVDPLAAVVGIRSVRYRPRDAAADRERTLWLPDPLPPEPPEEVLAVADTELLTARERKRNGQVPVGLGRRARRDDPTYGVIAEDVREVAPDAVVMAGDGETPMVDHGALFGLLFGAVKALSGKVDDLTARLDTGGPKK